MIETPYGFLEVEGEANGTDAMKFGEAQFGETPKTLDAVDVISATGELIFVMMNTMMFIAIENEAVVGLPAIGIDRGLREHLPPDNGHQCLLGAVLDDLRKDLPAAFEQADHGGFPAGSTPALAAHPAGPKVTLVHLHFPSHRPLLFPRQLPDPQPQPIIIALRRVPIQPHQCLRRKHLHQRPHFSRGNLRIFDISVGS